MTLKNSGTITLSEIEAELSETGIVSLGDANVRELFGVPSGPISFSDAYGKRSGSSTGTSGGLPSLYGFITTTSSITFTIDAYQGATYYAVTVEGTQHGYTTAGTYTLSRSNQNVPVSLSVMAHLGATLVGPSETYTVYDNALPAPTLTITSITSDSVTFTIGTVAGATGYKAYVTKPAVAYTSAGSHTITGLTPNCSYYSIYAYATDSTTWRDGRNSPTLKFATLPLAPGAVTLSSFSTAPLEISFTIVPDTWSTSFIVRCSNGVDYPFTTAGAHVIQNLTPNTAYTFSVAGKNIATTGAFSTPIAQTTKLSIPATPTLANFVGNANSITFTINPVSGATSYNVRLGSVNQYNYSTTNYTSAGTYTTGYLATKSVQSFQVNAVNATGASEFSLVEYHGTYTDTIDTPVITEISAGSGSVNIHFVPVGSAVVTRYEVQVRDTGVWSTTASSTVVGPISIGGMSSETYYHINIRAYDGSVYSAWSGDYEVKTLVAPPANPGFVIDSTSTTSVTFTLSKTAKAAWYEVMLDSAVNAYEFPTSNYGYYYVEGTYTLAGMLPSTLYNLQVRAGNQGGASSRLTYQTTTPAQLPASPTVGSILSRTPTSFVIAPLSHLANNATATVNGSAFQSSVVYYQQGTTYLGGIIVTGLTQGTTYSFTLSATNASGTVSSGVAYSVTTEWYTPIAPFLTDIATTGSSISFNIVEVPGAANYYVDFSILSGNYIGNYSYTSPGVKTFTGLTPSTAYSLLTSASNSSGISSYRTFTAQTMDGKPTRRAVLEELKGISPTSMSFTATCEGATSVVEDKGIDGLTSTLPGVPGTFPVTPGTYYSGSIYGTTYYGAGPSLPFSFRSMPYVPTVASVIPSGPVTTTSLMIDISTSWSGYPGTSYILVYNSITRYIAAPALGYELTGLTQATTYNITAQAVNESGIGPVSPVCTISTLAELSGIPTGITISNQTPTGYRVSWDTVTYAVQYGLRVNGVQLSSTITTLYYDVTGGAANTVYPITLCSYNAVGLPSAFSTAVNATTTHAYASVPATPTISTVSSTAYTVSWLSSANAVSYAIVVNGVVAVSGITTLSRVMVGLAYTAYSVTVKALNVDGIYSAESTAALTTTLATAPTFTGVNSTGYRVNWTAITGSTSYAITVGGVLKPSTSALFYDMTGSASTTYAVLVRYYNASSVQIATSDSASVTTLAAAAAAETPAAPTFSTVTTSGYVINWAASANATRYAVYVDSVLKSSTVTALSYSMTATEYSTHAVYLVAYNSDGTASASGPTASVTTLANAAGTPAMPTFSLITASGYRISWFATANAVRYAVVVDGTTQSSSVTTTYYDMTSAAYATHSVVIYAANVASISSPASPAGSVTTLALAAATPATPTTSGVSATGYTINWAACTNATQYVLYVDNTLVGSTTNLYWTMPSAASTYHTFYLYAVNAAGTYSAASPTGTVTTPAVALAATPATPTFTSITTSGYRINWTAAANAIRYAVVVDTVEQSTAVTTLYYDMPSAAYTSHAVYLYAYNSVGTRSAASTTASVTTLAVSAATPSTPTFTSIAYNSYRVNWTTAANAVKYVVVVDSVVVNSNVTNLYYDMTSAASTAHSVYLYAVNISGAYSAASTTASVTTPAAPLAATPATPTTSGVSATGYTINWAACTNATQYVLYVDSTLVGSTTNLYWTMISAASTYHTFYLYAVNVSGVYSAASPTGAITTSAALAGVPAAPTYTNVTDVGYRINWVATTNAVRYAVYSQGVTQSTNVTNTYFDMTGTASTTYNNNMVAAFNSAGVSSAWSPASTVTTTAVIVPATPSTPTFTNVTTSGYRVNWTACLNAARYYLVVDSSVASSNITNLYYDMTSAPGTFHTAYLFAVSASGTFSAVSNTASLTTTALAVGNPGTPTFTHIYGEGYTVNWAAAVNAVSYTIYKNGLAFVTGISSGTTSYALSSAASTTTYISVTAYNSAGAQGIGGSAPVTTLAAGTPETPQAPTFTLVSAGGSCRANWPTCAGVYRYHVWVVDYYYGTGTVYGPTTNLYYDIQGHHGYNLHVQILAESPTNIYSPWGASSVVLV